MPDALCFCDTQKKFSECCDPVLKGERVPVHAVDLMRARYSAFVLHDIDFLMNSVTSKLKKDIDRKSIEEWSKNSQWDGLEILATDQGGPGDEVGQVEFKAKFREKEEAREHHEVATFVKTGGSWFFDDGKPPVSKPVKSTGPKIGRNDPCHCGSGKKYKKCHGMA